MISRVGVRMSGQLREVSATEWCLQASGGMQRYGATHSQVGGVARAGVCASVCRPLPSGHPTPLGLQQSSVGEWAALMILTNKTAGHCQ
jgi:hypothetical protein